MKIKWMTTLFIAKIHTDKKALSDQLYSFHCLHLWRTGVATFSYCADEDRFNLVSFFNFSLHMDISYHQVFKYAFQ